MKYQLNDVFPNWLTSGGIFALLTAAAGGEGLPWSVDASILDIDYHGNYSGDKLVSPLIRKMIKANDGELLTVTQRAQLALIIYSRFIDNWRKRWTALQTVYNPLENYSMSENETGEGTNTGTVQNADSITRNNSRDNTVNVATEGQDNIFGFNSSTESPANSNTGTSETSSEETESESESATGTRTDNLANTFERSLTRSGNIGVTTSQQMLESELEIRKYDFFVSVYEDIDKVLTIPVY